MTCRACEQDQHLVPHESMPRKRASHRRLVEIDTVLHPDREVVELVCRDCDTLWIREFWTFKHRARCNSFVSVKG